MPHNLTQKEADQLLQMEKVCLEKKVLKFPALGNSLHIPLYSKPKKEDFILDISRSNIVLEKNTLQMRARKKVVLVRLDTNGQHHRNPDNTEITCPHLHLYREGYDDKWAYPLPSTFTNPNDIIQTFKEFLIYCNVTSTQFIRTDILI
ncbi:MAG: hypothetical protein LBC20_13345 [Planctomycetaceae bacterium]|nr:hypothetical protein [Planctomycetaceae bacterium]